MSMNPVDPVSLKEQELAEKSYWGNARPSGVGISGVTLEKKPASSGTLTPSEGSAFHKP